MRILCARERVGGDSARVRAVWEKQHEAAGRQMFRLCVDLKGFYIKASAACPSSPPPAAFSVRICDATGRRRRLCSGHPG